MTDRADIPCFVSRVAFQNALREHTTEPKAENNVEKS